MPAIAEELPNMTLVNPYANVSEVNYFGCNNVWFVGYGENTITLTCVDPVEDSERDGFSAVHIDVTRISEHCPRASSIFSAETEPDGTLDFTVPTIEGANRFALETFDGLHIAGIQAYQTDDEEYAEPATYLELLRDNKQAVAYGHFDYLHDMVGHWLAAASVEDTEFEVFKALCVDALSLYDGSQHDYDSEYVEIITEVFDRYTESLAVRITSDSVDQCAEDGFLLSFCLERVYKNYPEYYERVASIIGSFNLGQIQMNAAGKQVLTWDFGVPLTHYRQIAERLK